jgi:hypothetical protein
MRFISDDPGEKKKEDKGLPKLVRVFDREGKAVREFGEPRDFRDEIVNTGANEVIMTVDGAGQVYLAFPAQNRVEKYTAEGKLLAERTGSSRTPWRSRTRARSSGAAATSRFADPR